MEKTQKLRAIVIGTGWASEGHTLALRDAGVDVVALCGRTPDPTHERARKLGIEEVSLDWRQALTHYKPDIVSIATTANVHYEIIMAAAQMGIHIFCDKPLGINAVESKNMLIAVKNGGVKHAYASTHQYGPAYLYAQQLVADGLLGQVWQAEYISHSLFPTRALYNWVHQLNLGGGYLNGIFTHNLGEVLRVTGGKVLSSTGCVTRRFGLIPVGAPVHDFREIFGKQISDEEITGWKESDADIACMVMVRLEFPGGGQAIVLFQTSAGSFGEYPGYRAFIGTEGTLRINLGETNKVLISTKDQPNWKELPIPQTIVDRLPRVKDWIQGDWNQLAREFVAHIEGQKYMGYPTFYDGWIANQVIDSVRASQGWVSIEHEPF